MFKKIFQNAVDVITSLHGVLLQHTFLKYSAPLLIMVAEPESRQLPEWVTLEEAFAWKGVMEKTISEKPNRQLMPPLSERQKVDDRLRWPREIILEWSRKNDEELKILSQGLKVF